MENRKIVDYYSQYDEDSRLIKDNAHRVEFDTTIHFMEQYVKPYCNILDVGAGTGRYSFYYALKESSVFAMDLVEKHVKILSAKLLDYKDLRMSVAQGDALDLSRFSDEEFDVILCMGPMYHLSSEDERIQCINECKRVLRSKGILAIAYINELREFGGNPCFWGVDSDTIEAMLQVAGFKIVNHIATDGVTPNIAKFINRLDDHEYKSWLDFHLKTCRTKASIENTLHALVVAQKF